MTTPDPIQQATPLGVHMNRSPQRIALEVAWVIILVGSAFSLGYENGRRDGMASVVSETLKTTEFGNLLCVHRKEAEPLVQMRCYALPDSTVREAGPTRGW